MQKIIFLLMIQSLVSSAWAQCNSYSYLLKDNIPLNVKQTQEKFSDMLRYQSCLYKKGSNYKYSHQKMNELEMVQVELKQNDCLNDYQYGKGSFHFRKNKIYQIHFVFYFNLEDSTALFQQFNNLIGQNATQIKADFPLEESYDMVTGTEVSNGKEVVNPIYTRTPSKKYFKDESRKESVQIYYSYSNLHKEFELTIEYSNLKRIGL